MESITCPCIECIHHGAHNKCNAKNINLTYRNIVTVNDGRLDMRICAEYEMKEDYKRNLDFLARQQLVQKGGYESE